MYHQLIEDYLTHYQPALKAELILEQTLQAYLESQAEAMVEAKRQILAQRNQREPHLSPLQREMEADQTVIALFLPLP